MKMLQFVKSNLKEWNKVSLGDIKGRKKNILEDIVQIDVSKQQGSLTSELAALRALRKR